MIEKFDIAGYCRISVDDELDRDNTSIENQKAIIEDYVARHFPGSSLTIYEDRDRSGYTFEQRESYQAMRRKMLSRQYDILVVKDFSRFSRRNSRGLVELEDLRDAGMRIISIGDGIDFPNDDDWLKIQFQFLINEMPVTDTSKKVRSVVKRRQKDGKWICAAPYGYIVNKQQQFELVPTEAEVVREVFRLYNAGWGYKKIANHLTDQGIPTPRMAEKTRKEAAGEICKLAPKSQWSLATIQGILDNDFYIGTLRQGKYTRRKINGADIKQEEENHIVFEHHHQAIIDYRTFAITRALREKRSTSHYRGTKKYDNVYTGFMVCGDCGSPMFSMSRSDLSPAYICGNYHRRGRKGCTSHHIRVDKLDELLKAYVRRILDNSAQMIDYLNAELSKEKDDIHETEKSTANIEDVILELQEELKVTKRQRVRDIMRHPDQEEILTETYDEMEADLIRRISGLQNQLTMVINKRNTIIKTNRIAKTALDVFHDILEKHTLERNDLELVIDQIIVFEDHLEIRLKTDIDGLLQCEVPEIVLPCQEEQPVNFKKGTKNNEFCLVQAAERRPDKVFRVNVISDGDPLEIFTEKDGEVIFKKYSPMGELSQFAETICDSLGRNMGCIAAVSDRDAIIALSGAPKRDLMDKPNSQELDQIMQQRKSYRYTGGSKLRAAESVENYYLGVASPILSEGDLMGCVMVLMDDKSAPVGETEQKVCQTVAGFLGRQMES